MIVVPANVLLAEDKQELGHHGGDVPGGVGQQAHLAAGGYLSKTFSFFSDQDLETRTEDSPVLTSGCSPPQASLSSHSPFGKVCLTF